MTTIRLQRSGQDAQAIYRWLFDNIAEVDKYSSAVADVMLTEAVDLLRQRRFTEFFDKLEEAQCWEPELQVPIADIQFLGGNILIRIMTKFSRYPAAWLPHAETPPVILRALSTFAVLRKQISGPFRNAHVDLFMQTVMQSAVEPHRDVVFLGPAVA